LGTPRSTDLREVLNALLYVASTVLPVADAAEGFSALLRRSKIISTNGEPLDYRAGSTIAL
jgi:hypothetical protein